MIWGKYRFVHWTELKDNMSGWAYATEWNYYIRIVCRLLTEGHQGRWVAIKGESLIGFWDTLTGAETSRIGAVLETGFAEAGSRMGTNAPPALLAGTCGTTHARNEAFIMSRCSFLFTPLLGTLPMSIPSIGRRAA